MKLNIKKFIKTSRGLKITKENGKIIVENNTPYRKKIIFTKLIFNKKYKFLLESNIETIKGEDCSIKLINRKGQVVERIDQNSKVVFNEIPRVSFLGISFEPNSSYVINKIEYSNNYDISNEINEYFKNDILLLCPGYPSNNNKYNCSFIHSRVCEYEKNGMGIDVVVVNENTVNKTEFYEFEGKRICMTSYGEVRNILLKKHYSKLLVHFLLPSYFKILDAVDTRNTNIILYSHGVDTLYRAFNRIGSPYFTTDFEIPEDYKKNFIDRDEEIFKYNNQENCKFVFVSNWNKEYSERLLNIKYNNSEIIPCFIDDKLYSYEKKNPELRKNIFVIRPQEDLNSYSMDINVRTILELSHRECFKDMNFSIYGDGSMHDELLEPLRGFDNVHIYKKFLSHEEIAKMHKENGIGLFASRFDTQAVSSCEAAMSGVVVITSKGIGTEEYIDPNIGTYCETENYKEYADLIEKIYNNPKLFSEMSEKMHDSVMKTCSYDVSIKKDIEQIKSFNTKEKIVIPSLKENPLLTVSIACYNVSNFIVQAIIPMLRSKYASELEILVVNDGSKDDTVAKVEQFIKENYTEGKTPIIKVIDKENGGHGSTINKGIELATGKYFRLLDGDDYYVTSEFDKYMERLMNEDSDLILTNYVEDFAITGTTNRTRNYKNLVPYVKYRLEDLVVGKYGFDNWGPLLSTSTYKTKLLKDANFKIDEHCFYVDMEYNLIGYMMADTVTYYPLDIYNYYLGRPGQSISYESFKRNILQHERVCMRVVNEFKERSNVLSDNKKKYIIEKVIVPLCRTQYELTIQRFRKNDKFKSFDNKFKTIPEFYNDSRIAGRQVKLHRATNGLLIWLNPFIQKIRGIFGRK